MEVTAEADGTVEAVHVKPGDKVAVGGRARDDQGERCRRRAGAESARARRHICRAQTTGG